MVILFIFTYNETLFVARYVNDRETDGWTYTCKALLVVLL